MQRLVLHRSVQGKHGTFGILAKDGYPLCNTCEDDWVNNQNNISCIPGGIYKCSAYSSAKYKDVWQVNDVPGRTAILIHAGNTIKDTEGCILVGGGFAIFNGVAAIINSQDTLARLRQVLPKEFELEIVGP